MIFIICCKSYMDARIYLNVKCNRQIFSHNPYSFSVIARKALVIRVTYYEVAHYESRTRSVRHILGKYFEQIMYLKETPEKNFSCFATFQFQNYSSQHKPNIVQHSCSSFKKTVRGNDHFFSRCTMYYCKVSTALCLI